MHPTHLKGSLTSEKTVELLSRAAREVFGDCECLGVPVADGGEGTVEAVIAAETRLPSAAPPPMALERAEELYYEGALRMFRFVRTGMEMAE